MRKFSGLSLMAVILVTAASCRMGTSMFTAKAGGGDLSSQCSVVKDRKQIELRSPALAFNLDTSDGLRAVSLKNKQTGNSINLMGGTELSFDLDAAEDRYWITGWRYNSIQKNPGDPDKEAGLLAGFAKPAFDDRKWQGSVDILPLEFSILAGPQHKWVNSKLERWYVWARTHVFLPEEAKGQKLSLTLGGLGLYDFAYMRVFVNGKEVGVQWAKERWHEPRVFDIGPDSEIYKHLRFDNDNVIALQLHEYRKRSDRLRELDPENIWIVHERMTYSARSNNTSRPARR